MEVVVLAVIALILFMLLVLAVAGAYATRRQSTRHESQGMQEAGEQSDLRH